MKTNINISGIKKHFFPKNSTFQDNLQTIKTKLTKYNFYSVNEAQISDIIRVIPYYFNRFNIVEDYDFTNISQSNEKYIEKLNLKTNDRYLIFNYKNDNFIDFNTFIFKFKSIKKLIFMLIESLLYTLNSLCIINDYGVCFFNLNPENIVFLNDCRAVSYTHLTLPTKRIV